MNDWRPISEAPTNNKRVYYHGLVKFDHGPRILAKGGNLSRVAIVRWVGPSHERVYGNWFNDQGWIVVPELWMPLPE